MNESNQDRPQTDRDNSESVKKSDRLIDNGLNVVSGGIAGSLIGKAIGGKTGAITGAIAGLVAGSLLRERIVEGVREREHKVIEVLGETVEDEEIPAHYNWEQLQALSQPQY